MVRRPLIGGNWKMHLERESAVALASAIAGGLGSDTADCDVIVFPPPPYLRAVSDVLGSSACGVGGQDVSDRASGAFTGQVSAAMLLDCGCTTTLVGHSERRHGLGENDALLARKVCMALETGLSVLLCVGETLDQRDDDRTAEVVCAQVVRGLDLVDQSDLDRVDLAYEPVWAIGTGRTAGPEEAQEVHAEIRSVLKARYDARSAAAIRIAYGGSVKPGNAAELMACEDVDGALVGGASLEAGPFLEILRAAARAQQPDSP